MLARDRALSRSLASAWGSAPWGRHGGESRGDEGTLLRPGELSAAPLRLVVVPTRGGGDSSRGHSDPSLPKSYFNHHQSSQVRTEKPFSGVSATSLMAPVTQPCFPSLVAVLPALSSGACSTHLLFFYQFILVLHALPATDLSWTLLHPLSMYRLVYLGFFLSLW